MLSKFFISRPIFATVIALIMMLAGILCVTTLPVAQYPDITPPTVMVSATYPGADALTVAQTVGIPIEEQVNGVEGMMYMSSTSNADGSYALTVTFNVGTNIDIATVKVQNRIALAEAQLPSAVKQQGVSVSSHATNIVQFIAIESDLPTDNALYLTNYAKQHIVDELSRIDGVGNVSVFGAGEYSMRIWLDPDALRLRGLTTTDVVDAICAQNIAVSAGATGQAPQPHGTALEFTLTANGQLSSPTEFADIVIATDTGNSIVRLSDIAEIDLGSESYSTVARVNTNPAGLLAIYQLPGANALKVARDVDTKLNELSQYFPEGIHYRIILDSTQFVTASISEVIITFIETTLIVLLVILLFLQNWRAVVIPMLTIPISLIATFAVMKLLGFSLNTLTLFGMVLAIAIVVDDAIVVVEGCSRLIGSRKLPPRQAVAQAMQELQGPIIGEVLVLLSVFIPTAFISGITGQLYKQFALVIAISTAFSGFNALTFTPAMCALFLKPTKPSRSIVFSLFNKALSGTLHSYTRIAGGLLRKPLTAIAIYAIVCIAAALGFSHTPSSYIPAEDMGYFMTAIQLPPNASLQRTDSVTQRVTADIMSLPEVADVISVAGVSFMGGGNSSNGGSLFVMLKPWHQRRSKSMSVDAVISKVSAMTEAIQEAEIFSLNPPAIPGLGLTSGLTMQLLDINNRGASNLMEAIHAIQAASNSSRQLANVTSLYQGPTPQYAILIDRDKVALQQLSLSDVFTTLSDFMGDSYVNDFIAFNRVYQVTLSATDDARVSPTDVLRLSVANTNRQMVPFSSFAEIVPTAGLSTVSRYNMYDTAALTATTANGISADAGIRAMEELVDTTLHDDYAYAWTGEAYQETESGATIAAVLLLAVVMTLLIMAAQYESITDPIVIIIAMPTAILGTVLGCLLMHQDISIYTQIGIILLLGLSAKNAILIVQYARDFNRQGASVSQAAIDAGRIRLRPILMTAMAFVFGVIPMLFATGAGANARLSLGTAVVFGMAVNALVGMLFIPAFWAVLQRRKSSKLPPTPKRQDFTM